MELTCLTGFACLPNVLLTPVIMWDFVKVVSQEMNSRKKLSTVEDKIIEQKRVFFFQHHPPPRPWICLSTCLLCTAPGVKIRRGIYGRKHEPCYKNMSHPATRTWRHYSETPGTCGLMFTSPDLLFISLAGCVRCACVRAWSYVCCSGVEGSVLSRFLTEHVNECVCTRVRACV